jgi:hypothetical protein
MNEKFEYHVKQIIKLMNYKIYFQLLIAILLLITSVLLYLNYEDPFYTFFFTGIIAILLIITALLMISMRKKLVWILTSYETNKEDIIDYLKIYLKNLEYNQHRNFLFRLSQRKEEAHYHEAFKALTGFVDEENE